MAPLASTHVVHPRWAEHHAPVAEGSQNADVQITHGATPGSWSAQTGPTPGTAGTTWSGRALVAYPQASNARRVDAADQPITSRYVRVEIPRTAPTQPVGSRVKITAVDANGPAGLVNHTLVVDSLDLSSQAVVQVLLCLDDQTVTAG